jgi:hypothetical protein
MTINNQNITHGPSPDADPTGRPAPAIPPPTPRRQLIPLPALAAISLYMVILAVVDVVGVVGGQFRPIYLVVAALFLAAAGGLLLLFRWAWSLTLAAVILLAGLFFFKFYFDQQLPFVIQGLMNLIFFLYLVRPEVREKLR